MTMSQNSFGQNKHPSCAEWHKKVDSHMPLVLDSDKDEDEFFTAVDCLLQLEGNKEESNVAGAARGSVSNLFGPTSVEVAALYYISYLFFQKWDHADAPFLLSERDRKLM